MKDNIHFVITLVLLVWGLYVSIKKRQAKYWYAVIGFVGIMLTSYPVNLPRELSFAVLGGIGAWIVISESNKVKDKWPLRVASIILVAFTIIFLIQTILAIDTKSHSNLTKNALPYTFLHFKKVP